jgi:hypothetical protein
MDPRQLYLARSFDQRQDVFDMAELDGMQVSFDLPDRVADQPPSHRTRQMSKSMHRDLHATA